MREFVLHVARALAEHPEAVDVAELAGRHTTVLELRCDRRDLGRLIGRSGKTIGAMRTLLAGVAARQHRKALLEVAEERNDGRAPAN